MTGAGSTAHPATAGASTGGPEGDGALEFAAEYHRRAEVLAEPGLPRLRRFLDLLGNPQRSFPSILVAGSVGKSSTIAAITALLDSFGIRAGSLTSPGWLGVEQRVVMAGSPITPEVLGRAYEDIAPYLPLIEDDGELSAFELLAVVTFAAFADAPVDLAVIESGPSPRTDLADLLDAVVAVITPSVLADRPLADQSLAVRPETATPGGAGAERVEPAIAGAIRSGSLTVLAQQPLPVAEVLLRQAAETGTTVAREGLEFGVVNRLVAVGGQMIALKGLGGGYEEIFLPLHGAHQAHNAAVALAAVEAFLGGGRNQLDAEAIRAGFAKIDSRGRLEVVRRSPTIVLDGAASPAAAGALASALEESFTFDTLVGVLGVDAAPGGEDAGVPGERIAVDMIAALEPVLTTVVVTQETSPGALPVDELAAIAVDVFGADRVEVAPRLDDALDAAVRLAEEEAELGGAGVIVTGSLSLAGQARTLLRR